MVSDTTSIHEEDVIILQFLHQMSDVSALLMDDALLKVLSGLQKSSGVQLLLLRHWSSTR